MSYQQMLQIRAKPSAYLISSEKINNKDRNAGLYDEKAREAFEGVVHFKSGLDYGDEKYKFNPIDKESRRNAKRRMLHDMEKLHPDLIVGPGIDYNLVGNYLDPDPRRYLMIEVAMEYCEKHNVPGIFICGSFQAASKILYEKFGEKNKDEKVENPIVFVRDISGEFHKHKPAREGGMPATHSVFIKPGNELFNFLKKRIENNSKSKIFDLHSPETELVHVTKERNEVLFSQLKDLGFPVKKDRGSKKEYIETIKTEMPSEHSCCVLPDALKKVKNYDEIGFSSDGIEEFVIMGSKRNMFGFQGHPEDNYLLLAFLAATALSMAKKHASRHK